jgi:hypothetical protein
MELLSETPKTSARPLSGTSTSPIAPSPKPALTAARLEPEPHRQQEIVAWIAIAAIWILSAFAFYCIWAKANGGV